MKLVRIIQSVCFPSLSNFWYHPLQYIFNHHHHHHQRLQLIGTFYLTDAAIKAQTLKYNFFPMCRSRSTAPTQHSPHTPTQMPADPKGANAMHAPLNYVYVERSKAYNSVIDSLGCPFQIIIDTNSLACTIIYRESK